MNTQTFPFFLQVISSPDPFAGKAGKSETTVKLCVHDNKLGDDDEEDADKLLYPKVILNISICCRFFFVLLLLL